MIYYFSGTGNSLHVARQLADRLCEQLSPIVNPVLTHDKSIGLVFPVYSWGIPSVVDNFIRRFFQSAEVQSETTPAYVYALMTCTGTHPGRSCRRVNAEYALSGIEEVSGV